MSLEIFKQNMLSYMRNQRGVNSSADFAKKLTMEYDMAVKRGFETVNGVVIGKGNTALMETLLKNILTTAFQQSSGEHPIITNMGPAFIGYWTGAVMSTIPPITPATNSIMNIVTVNSFITDPGIWQPTDIASVTPPPPTPIQTQPVVATEVVGDDTEYELDEADIEARKQEIRDAEEIKRNVYATEEQVETADEYIVLREEEISTGKAESVPVEEITDTPETVGDLACRVGEQIVFYAKKDIGVIETGTRANNGAGLNYGGKVGGGETPVGKPGRIDIMVKLTGLDNQQQLNQTGQGYYWCAAAVTAWWKSAGLKVPPGSAACKNWAKWGKQQGLYSKKPKVGAAVLYGGEGREHHIGIVTGILPDGNTILTIEGNTGGGGFNRNGCGCFAKKTKLSKVSGFIVPPGCN
jgi:hypothetical protein